MYRQVKKNGVVLTKTLLMQKLIKGGHTKLYKLLQLEINNYSFPVIRKF